MAIRGRKPSATIMRLLAGNPGHRPIPQGEPEPGGGQSRRASGAMTDPGDAADRIYAALVAAQRNAGDVPLCLALEKLAGDIGQNKFRHAASILRGTVLGRSAIDDGEALRRIANFPPARRRDAVGLVARRLAGAGATDAQIEAIARRLRRKLKTQTDKMVLSAASVP